MQSKMPLSDIIPVWRGYVPLHISPAFGPSDISPFTIFWQLTIWWEYMYQRQICIDIWLSSKKAYENDITNRNNIGMTMKSYTPALSVAGIWWQQTDLITVFLKLLPLSKIKIITNHSRLDLHYTKYPFQGSGSTLPYCCQFHYHCLLRSLPLGLVPAAAGRRARVQMHSVLRSLHTVPASPFHAHMHTSCSIADGIDVLHHQRLDATSDTCRHTTCRDLYLAKLPTIRQQGFNESYPYLIRCKGTTDQIQDVTSANVLRE